MGLKYLVNTALKDLSAACVLLQERFAPESLLRKNARLCRRAGMQRPNFILSFDCDTEKDFAVVGDVHARLHDIGIMPAYAVPGELLERGAVHYTKVAETGAEFLNHGHAEHTIFDEKKNAYICTLYYHLLSQEAVQQDIISGHETVMKVLGKSPLGFRAPHFGSYQKPADLRFMHGVLKEKGYRYSSSTIPLYGLKHGPVFDRFGLLEIPVTGCAHWPATILDSYTFRFSPGDKFTPKSYVTEVKALAARMDEVKAPFLVNIYADPSQVYDWPEFFEAMKTLAPYNIPSYGAFLDGLNL